MNKLEMNNYNDELKDQLGELMDTEEFTVLELEFDELSIKIIEKTHYIQIEKYDELKRKGQALAEGLSWCIGYMVVVLDMGVPEKFSLAFEEWHEQIRNG